jgi:hypothetical protein
MFESRLTTAGHKDRPVSRHCRLSANKRSGVGRSRRTDGWRGLRCGCQGWARRGTEGRKEGGKERKRRRARFSSSDRLREVSFLPACSIRRNRVSWFLPRLIRPNRRRGWEDAARRTCVPDEIKSPVDGLFLGSIKQDRENAPTVPSFPRPSLFVFCRFSSSFLPFAHAICVYFLSSVNSALKQHDGILCQSIYRRLI